MHTNFELCVSIAYNFGFEILYLQALGQDSRYLFWRVPGRERSISPFSDKKF